MYSLLKGISLSFYTLSKRRREVTIDNLKQAFPEKSDQETAHLSKAVFIELSKTVAEIFLMLTGRFDPDQAVVNRDEAIRKLKVLRNTYSGGWMMVTAHFSNWELLAQVLAKNGFPMLIVGREGDNKLIDKNITLPLRQRYGSRTVYKKKAAVAILKSLKRGEIVGALIDQKVNAQEGLKVKFFGREVYMTGLVATMKQKLNITVIPIFLPRIGEGKYKIVMEEPIEVSDDAVHMTQAYSDALERVIKAYPEQWFWMHNRWKV